MIAKLKVLWDVLKQTASEWSNDNAPRLGASLAFYTMLSLAPLLVVVVASAGMAFGEEAARGELVNQIESMIGPEGASAVQTMLANAYQPTVGIWATSISVVVLLVGATGVFVELKDSLNIIWDVPPRQTSGVWNMIKSRLLSFAMVLGIGFLLLISLVLSAVLAAVSNFFGGAGPAGLWRALELVVSFGVLTLLFAMIYKFLPDVQITWGDVWVGAALTAALFTLGKYLIGLYLGSSSFDSTYGAAGSLAVFLIWVYYSAQIVFFGAELTEVYANRFGSRLQYRKEAAHTEHGEPGAGEHCPAGQPEHVGTDKC
ncbi:MAG: YihY/virulence factor BrkB family protein [Gemmataceae bacterium]|nr:YihY/virulence factor BrkB family protein [Gemmataceae bacterium]